MNIIDFDYFEDDVDLDDKTKIILINMGLGTGVNNK